MVKVETKEKADLLRKFLNELSFVSKVRSLKSKMDLKEALEEHETFKKSILKRKNKAIAKYL